MPITADLGGKNYTLGRGRVYFERFSSNAEITALTRGDGERYIGNTPEFNNSSESENLDHYDSDQGIRVKDDSVQLTFEQTVSLVLDSIDEDNIALYFLGTKDSVTQLLAEDQTETITDVKKGRFYQLGVTESRIAGARKIANLVVKVGATTITAGTNYQVDADRGRVYILPNAATIVDGDDVIFEYDITAYTADRVISGSSSIYGALRFIADNPKGVNRDYYFPYVKLSPDGDYSLKGDEWQQMGFTMEVLRKSSNTPPIIIDSPAVAA